MLSTNLLKEKGLSILIYNTGEELIWLIQLLKDIRLHNPVGNFIFHPVEQYFQLFFFLCWLTNSLFSLVAF